MNVERLKNSDSVVIEGYVLEASVGVFDWEKTVAQKLVFDLVLACDFSVAAQNDHIDDTVDYSRVCEEIDSVVTAQHYDLLETLAKALEEMLFSRFKVSAIDMKISKPGAVAKAKSVGIHIKRFRETE